MQMNHPACSFSSCPHPATGSCDCTWTELQHWPDDELAKRLAGSPSLFRQAIKDAAASEAQARTHDETLRAIEAELDRQADNLPDHPQARRLRLRLENILMPHRWHNHPRYLEHAATLSRIGDRTDIDTVYLEWWGSLDLVLANSKTCPEDDLVTIYFTSGESVRQVFERYRQIAHAIIPDNAQHILWHEIAVGPEPGNERPQPTLGMGHAYYVVDQPPYGLMKE